MRILFTTMIFLFSTSIFAQDSRECIIDDIVGVDALAQYLEDGVCPTGSEEAYLAFCDAIDCVHLRNLESETPEHSVSPAHVAIDVEVDPSVTIVKGKSVKPVKQMTQFEKDLELLKKAYPNHWVSMGP